MHQSDICFLTENRKLIFSILVMLIQALRNGTGESKVPINVAGALFEFGMPKRVINVLASVRWKRQLKNPDLKEERHVFESLYWNESEVVDEHDGRELTLVFDSVLLQSVTEDSLMKQLNAVFFDVKGVAQTAVRFALEELEGQWRDWQGERFLQYIEKDVMKKEKPEALVVKTKPVLCPMCGKRKLAQILYGNIEYTGETRIYLKRGKLIVGDKEEGLPRATWQCGSCGLRLWKTKDFEKIEL